MATSNQRLSMKEDCFARLRALGLEPRDKKHHKSLKRASVLVLLFTSSDDDELWTLITKRSMNLRSHPGECCFPGGRQDEQDHNDDVQTALREAQEEIGLDPAHVEILGRLPTVESVNHLCVTSIIGKIKHDDDKYKKDFMRQYPWKINPDEVDHAFGVPLAFFLQDPVSSFQVQWSRETFVMRHYEYNDQGHSKETFAITGLTAHIAHEVAATAHGITTVGPPVEQGPTRPKQQATTRPRDSTSPNDDDESALAGYLWKRELSSRGRPYWTRRYFVCAEEANPPSSPFLHQYDSEQHAHRRSQTATKKNRLPLQDCQLANPPPVDVDSTSPALSVNGEESKFEFVLEALGARIQWHLAAHSQEDRERWIHALVGEKQPGKEKEDA